MLNCETVLTKELYETIYDIIIVGKLKKDMKCYISYITDLSKEKVLVVNDCHLEFSSCFWHLLCWRRYF